MSSYTNLGMYDTFAAIQSGVPEVVYLTIVVTILVFDILMLLHVVGNPAITTQAKIWWVIGMMVLHPIVAVIYYFTDYKKK